MAQMAQMGIKIVFSHSVKQICNMKKDNLNRFLPYAVAIVLFATLSCIYCSPVFQGKELYAGDNLRFKEAVNESAKYHEDTGNYTWWTGSMFAGMPNYQIGGGHYKSSDLTKPLSKLLMTPIITSCRDLMPMEIQIRNWSRCSILMPSSIIC